MIPVAGSAYTYSYATISEFFAWTVGWALIMEYAIAASAVSVGWSGYFTGTILGGMGIQLPAWLSAGPLAFGGAEGGLINLPALVIALLVTWLLVVGTSESAKGVRWRWAGTWPETVRRARTTTPAGPAGGAIGW